MYRHIYSILIFVIFLSSTLSYGDVVKTQVHDKQYIYGNVNKPTIPTTTTTNDPTPSTNKINDSTEPNMEKGNVTYKKVDPTEIWDQFMLDYTTYQQPFSIIGAEHSGENSHISPTLSITQIKSDAFQAVQNDDIYKLRTLVEYIGTPDFIDDYKRTPLIYAAIYNSLDTIRLLIAMGADLNQKDVYSRTATYYVVLNQSTEAITLLAENGGYFDIADNEGITPIAILMSNNNYSLAHKLINLHVVDNIILSKLLMSAVKRNDLVDVKFLASNNADVNIMDNANNTPLIIAVYNNNYDIAAVLIKYGANLDAQDNHGNTALMIATLNNNKRLIDALINAGANPSLRNHAGFAACDMGLNINNDAPLSKPFLKPDYANNPMTPPKNMKNPKKIPHHQKSSKVQKNKQEVKPVPVPTPNPPIPEKDKVDQKIETTIDNNNKMESSTSHSYEDNALIPKLNTAPTTQASSTEISPSVESSTTSTEHHSINDSTTPSATSSSAPALETPHLSSTEPSVKHDTTDISTMPSSAPPLVELPTTPPSIKPSASETTVKTTLPPTTPQQNVASTLPDTSNVLTLPPLPPHPLSPK